MLGERVHAVIVARNDVSAEALRGWCAERLSDYKVPETIALIAEPLPRNGNGKVMKRQLRDAFTRIINPGGGTRWARHELHARKPAEPGDAAGVSVRASP